MRTIRFATKAGVPLFASWMPHPVPVASASETDELLGAEHDEMAAESIEKHIYHHGLEVDGLYVSVDLAEDSVTVSGNVVDQSTADKVVLCCGNVQGIAQVKDCLTVAWTAPRPRWHMVKRGESLQKISQTYYGQVSGYRAIFEANYPMLDDPQHLYPGQVLSIPA
jgi:nucleoid-associated protein YgaU